MTLVDHAPRPFPSRAALYEPSGEPPAIVEPSTELWRCMKRGPIRISVLVLPPWMLTAPCYDPDRAAKVLPETQITLSAERVRGGPVGWFLVGRDQERGNVLRRAFPSTLRIEGAADWDDSLRRSILHAIRTWQ